MATGDNILTAICVSKECNLIKKDGEMYSCDLEKGKNGKDILKWKKIDGFDDDNDINNDENLNLNNTGKPNKKREENNNILLNEDININTSLDDLYPPEKIDSNYKANIKTDEIIENITNITNKKNLEILDDNNNIDNYIYNKDHINNTSRISNKTQEISIFDISDEDSPLNKSNDNFGIALTGNIFEKLFKLNEKYMKNKDPKLKSIHQSYRLILKNGRVFARMAPEHKALLVQAFKKEGFTTLMCGDGANDCAALRTASVGVSLSPEEASIAAGFTSIIPDVSCIFELLREGKCSLTTSIQTFKFMMLYSMTQFICVTLMLIYITYLNDFQFLVSDLFLIFPLEWFLAMTHPHDELTHHYPVSSLLSFPVISSIIIQTIFVFVFQLAGYHILRNHYKFENTCKFDINDDPIPCHENTIFFLITHFQYLTANLAFSISKPFRKPIYTNWPLMIYLLIVYFYSIWITINCDDWSAKLFNIYDLKYKGHVDDDDDDDDGEEENDEEEEENDDDDGENEIIPGGDKMKYYILLIVGINMIVNIFFEWVVMKFVNNYYGKKLIRDYKKEVEEEKITEAKNKAENKESEPNNKEVEIFKYQRIYYYNRRKKNEIKMDNNNENEIKIYSSERKINIIS
jgi:cation-transporting ATPase 13A3/4/5